MRPTFIAMVLMSCTTSALGQVPADLERHRLASDTVIDGVPCAPTGKAFAEFHQSGRLHSCPLSRMTSIAGHDFPAGTWLQFAADGRLWSAWLPSDTPLAGHLCRGTGYKGWSVRFHPSGALASCYLADESNIEGVWCQRGTFWNEILGGTNTTVGFREDGRLARCQASRDFTKDGVAISKWQVVELDSAGVVRVRSR